MSKQVVLITGASKGYGKGAATILVKDGRYDVVISARDPEHTEAAAVKTASLVQ